MNGSMRTCICNKQELVTCWTFLGEELGTIYYCRKEIARLNFEIGQAPLSAIDLPAEDAASQPPIIEKVELPAGRSVIVEEVIQANLRISPDVLSIHAVQQPSCNVQGYVREMLEETDAGTYVVRMREDAKEREPVTRRSKEERETA
ncbi:Beta-catenin-like protein 1 [Venturia nashicola]|uniref:Beta-catenin-like protein 1 n=1 Tax=Venturia nashicola TaxID=86259 RepID=A0A4Z1PDU6_9PEZI|nr:Beta-catenin-like protein 1 [Venturia nashicola]